MGTSPRPYRNSEIKDNFSQNPFIKPKSMVKQKTLEGERKERMKRWITFFRRNPHRFIMDYFGIYLHPFQVLMIWVLQRSNLAYIVASRAASKTWIIAVWSMTLAVLYPGIKIIACSKTLKQGGKVVEKIGELMTDHPNIKREIKNIIYSDDGAEVQFQCGSYIKVVSSSESARGGRANYLIAEEARLIPKEILEGVIKPFLEVRNPPYRNKPEYRNEPLLKEEGTISYITSAWYKSEYWFSYVKTCIRRMIAGDETANFLAFDYLITLYHNIKTEEMIKNEMSDMDTVSIQMEYLNIPAGSSNKSYFKPAMFKRTIKRAFYPFKDETFANKKNKNEIERVDGEMRFVSVDIAARAGKMNDNTILGCARCIPEIGKGYDRNLVYMESNKGQHTGVQAEKIKKIFFDFLGLTTQDEINHWANINSQMDFFVMDIKNIGVSIYDSLSQVTVCEDRGITYPALCVVDENYDFIRQEERDDLRNRTKGANPVPIIFPINANQALNSEIASSFRVALQKSLWHFLISEADAESFLIKSKNKDFMSTTDSDAYARFLNSYVNTSFLINECVNLDMTPVNGMIKLTEKSGLYKDRFSCISYMSWVLSFFDHNLLREKSEENDIDYILSLVQVV